MTTMLKKREIGIGDKHEKIEVYLNNKGVNPADYRLIEALTYVGDDSGIKLHGKQDIYVVPVELAEQVKRVVYRNDNSELTFEDINGRVFLTSPNFLYKNSKKVTAFSVEDLYFYWDELI